MSALCISCGGWKQAPMSRCGCGFAPARGSAAVTLCFLASGVLLGLLIGSIVARMQLPFLVLFGALAAVAFITAFRLMSHVDRKVAGR